MSIVDLIFPKFCLNCQLPGTYICPRCRNELDYYDKPKCLYCQRSSLHGLTHPNCLKKFNIDGTEYLFHYNSLLKKIVKNIKYRLATQVFKELTQIIKPNAIERLGFYNKLSGPIFFQPIPLSIRRIKDRGFNQALLLTKFFQRFFSFNISDFLIRIKDTKTQAELKSKKERYDNLRGAFKTKIIDRSLIKGSKIILIDDVVTTGSTVKEAARVLKRAGALKVYVFALAKG